MNIGLLSAAFPPDADAIGEYTWWLARQLRSEGHALTVFTSPGPHIPPDDGIQIIPCFDPKRAGSHREIPIMIAREHRRAPLDWVIVQYNPFSFGRRGFCPWMPGMLRSLRSPSPGPKIAAMFHEVFTSDPGPAAALMRIWQRPQSLAMAAQADCVFVSCAAYGEALKSDTWHLLPVGSNLPEPATLPPPSESNVIRLGAFGTGHVSHRFPLMARALREVCAQGIAAEFLFIGSGGTTAAPYFDGLPFRASGLVPAAEASRLLLSIDYLLAPFTDGLSTRRGSVVAALQHGRPVISNSGPNTDSLLLREHNRSLILSPRDNDDSFVEAVVSLARDASRRQAIGRHARSLFDDQFSWASVSSRLLAALRSST